MMTHIVGVDPGIVHTGTVSATFHPRSKLIEVQHEVVLGPDATKTNQVIDTWFGGAIPRIYIEGYRARSNLRHDKEMQVAVQKMRDATRGTVLDNTGVKKVVRPELLKLLGLWRFATPTHHDDLRSAARIAVLGMLKDDQLNKLLADVVRDHLDGRTWDVQST